MYSSVVRKQNDFEEQHSAESTAEEELETSATIEINGHRNSSDAAATTTNSTPGESNEIKAEKPTNLPVVLHSVEELERTLDLMRHRCITGNLKAAGLGLIDDEPAAYARLDPNAKMVTGESLLLATVLYIHEESKHGHYLMVLLHDGADPNFRDESGRTALMHACYLGKETASKHLLTFVSTDIYAQDNEGNTALMYAAVAGHEKILKLYFKFLHKNEKRKARLPNESIEGASSGLCHSQDCELLEIRNHRGETARCLALREGQMTCVQLLDEEKVKRIKALNKRLGAISHLRTSPMIGRRAKEYVKRQMSFDSLLQVEDPQNWGEEDLIGTRTDFSEKLSGLKAQIQFQSHPELTKLAGRVNQISLNSSSSVKKATTSISCMEQDYKSADKGLSFWEAEKPAITSDNNENRSVTTFTTDPPSSQPLSLSAKLRGSRAAYIQSKQQMLKGVAFTAVSSPEDSGSTTRNSPNLKTLNNDSFDAALLNNVLLYGVVATVPNIPKSPVSFTTKIKNLFHRGLKTNNTNALTRAYSAPKMEDQHLHASSDTLMVESTELKRGQSDPDIKKHLNIRPNKMDISLGLDLNHTSQVNRNTLVLRRLQQKPHILLQNCTESSQEHEDEQCTAYEALSFSVARISPALGPKKLPPMALPPLKKKHGSRKAVPGQPSSVLDVLKATGIGKEEIRGLSNARISSKHSKRAVAYESLNGIEGVDN